MFKDSEETSLAKPGKTSVANQAWTRRATRRQQITDLINDARARARLILAPKNLGTKVGCWLEIRCLPFGKDRYTWTVSHFSIQMSNTDAGFLMEIKPSCSLYGVNQGTHLCQNRDLLMILKWGDFISASAGSSAWMLATLLNEDFSELGTQLHFFLVSPHSLWVHQCYQDFLIYWTQWSMS